MTGGNDEGRYCGASVQWANIQRGSPAGVLDSLGRQLVMGGK